MAVEAEPTRSKDPFEYVARIKRMSCNLKEFEESKSVAVSKLDTLIVSAGLLLQQQAELESSMDETLKDPLVSHWPLVHEINSYLSISNRLLVMRMEELKIITDLAEKVTAALNEKANEDRTGLKAHQATLRNQIIKELMKGKKITVILDELIAKHPEDKDFLKEQLDIFLNMLKTEQEVA